MAEYYWKDKTKQRQRQKLTKKMTKAGLAYLQLINIYIWKFRLELISSRTGIERGCVPVHISQRSLPVKIKACLSHHSRCRGLFFLACFTALSIFISVWRRLHFGPSAGTHTHTYNNILSHKGLVRLLPYIYTPTFTIVFWRFGSNVDLSSLLAFFEFLPFRSP